MSAPEAPGEDAPNPVLDNPLESILGSHAASLSEIDPRHHAVLLDPKFAQGLAVIPRRSVVPLAFLLNRALMWDLPQTAGLLQNLVYLSGSTDGKRLDLTHSVLVKQQDDDDAKERIMDPSPPPGGWGK